jgi:hypothetical protein
MAIATPIRHFSSAQTSARGNAGVAALYILIGLAAIAVAVPAGLMTGSKSDLFAECYGDEACTGQTTFADNSGAPIR